MLHFGSTSYIQKKSAMKRRVNLVQPILKSSLLHTAGRHEGGMHSLTLGRKMFSIKQAPAQGALNCPLG